MIAAENKLNVRLRLGRLASIVMSMTLLSRLFGFLRDIILAQMFGATAAFDAFIIAFKIPNFMRRLFGEGAFSQAFIPVLAEYRIHHSGTKVAEFINKVTTVFGLFALLVVVIGEICAPLLVIIFAPGFVHDPTRYHLATRLIQITFPYLFSIALVALAGAILNTFNRFALSAFTPVLLNVILITVAWCWAPRVSPDLSIYVLAWGVMISGVVQLLIQIPVLKRLKLLPKFQWHWQETGVRRVMKQLLPALFGVSMAQICLLIDNLFASFLPIGSISWLYYSDRLIYLPLGVIGIALATVVMPNLSQQHHSGSTLSFVTTLDWAIRCAMLMAVPAAIGLFMLAGPILSTLLHHGSFTTQDVWMTRRSLMAFALGLPAFMLIKILASAFYSQQNIRTPVLIAALAIIINLILNFIFIHWLAHAGLALSTSLASWLNAMLLWVFLHKQSQYRLQAGWRRLTIGIVLASSLMALVLWLSCADLSDWLGWNTKQSGWRLILLIVTSIAIYFISLLCCGIRWSYFKPPIFNKNV